MFDVWELVEAIGYMCIGVLLTLMFVWKPYDKGWNQGYEDGWNDGYDDCMKYHEYKEITKV